MLTGRATALPLERLAQKPIELSVASGWIALFQLIGVTVT